VQAERVASSLEARPLVRPAMLRIPVVSSAAARRIAGRMVVRRCASLDVSAPGGRGAKVMGGGGVDVRHVNQDGGPEGEPVKGEPVPPEGRFRSGTAYQIVSGPLVQAAGFLDDFLLQTRDSPMASSVPGRWFVRTLNCVHGWWPVGCTSASRQCQHINRFGAFSASGPTRLIMMEPHRAMSHIGSERVCAAC
jgi:hypothetical protein